MPLILKVLPNTGRQFFRVPLRDLLPGLDEETRTGFARENAGPWQPWDEFTPWIRHRHAVEDREPVLCLAVETTLQPDAPGPGGEVAPAFASADEGAIDVDFGPERQMPLTYLPNRDGRIIDIDLALEWLRPEPGEAISVDLVVSLEEGQTVALLLEGQRTDGNADRARRAQALSAGEAPIWCDHGVVDPGSPEDGDTWEAFDEQHLHGAPGPEADVAAPWENDPFDAGAATADDADSRLAHALLGQAGRRIHALAWRHRAGNVHRARRLRDVRLVFASDMPEEARHRIGTAWQRAIDLFTAANHLERHPVSLRPALDAACCAQLPFVLSEIDLLGGQTGSWLDLLSSGDRAVVLGVTIGSGAISAAVVEYRWSPPRKGAAPVLTPRLLVQQGMELRSELPSDPSRLIEALGPAIDDLSGLVGAHGVHLVVLSGRTALLPPVRDRFIDRCPLLPQRIATLPDLPPGRTVPDLASFRANDARASTLLGAALWQDIASGTIESIAPLEVTDPTPQNSGLKTDLPS